VTEKVNLKINYLSLLFPFLLSYLSYWIFAMFDVKSNSDLWYFEAGPNHPGIVHVQQPLLLACSWSSTYFRGLAQLNWINKQKQLNML
jgi:hypothetical protein